MRGATAEKDLKQSQKEEWVIKAELEEAWNIVLESYEESLADFINPISKKTYEIKRDPVLGISGNFLIELLASWSDYRFEKGWIYRYKELDYLVYYNDSTIYLFDFKKLRQYFWFNRHKVGKDWVTVWGVLNNSECVVVLLPVREVQQFLVKKIGRIKDEEVH